MFALRHTSSVARFARGEISNRPSTATCGSAARLILCQMEHCRAGAYPKPPSRFDRNAGAMPEVCGGRIVVKPAMVLSALASVLFLGPNVLGQQPVPDAPAPQPVPV